MPRFAAALAISLVAHAGLVALFWLPVRPAATPVAISGPVYRTRLENWHPPRAARVVKPEEYIPVGIDARVGAPREVSPLTAQAVTPHEGPGRSGGVGRPSHRGSGGLLAAPATVRRVVYLIDRSVSMGPSGGLEKARHELREALAGLSPDTQFQVLFYNQGVEPVRPAGKTGLLLADPATIEQVLARLGDFPASGGTNHLAAFRAALWLRPEVLFLVTDADDLSTPLVREITRLNAGRARFQVIELSHQAAPDSPLAKLARLNRGYHRLVPPSP